MLEVFVHRDGVFAAVAVVSSVNVTPDHFQFSLLQEGVFPELVLLDLTLLSDLVPVDHRHVASLLDLESHKELAHVRSHLRDALVRLSDVGHYGVKRLHLAHYSAKYNWWWKININPCFLIN